MLQPKSWNKASPPFPQAVSTHTIIRHLARQLATTVHEPTKTGWMTLPKADIAGTLAGNPRGAEKKKTA